MAPKALTYKEAGVDIDVANEFVRRIKPLIKKTERPEVLSSIGHFAGLFALNKEQYREPILVASTDGVGTKVKLAVEWGRLSGIGQDLVAMSANDILCLGAEPLFFLDYFATGKLDLSTATAVLEGIARSCQSIHCSLLGGETSEMPKIYRGEDFDLAGFMVGIVEKEKIIDGSKIKPGDKLVGIASSGPHANGFALIRQILHDRKLVADKIYPPLTRPLADLLLEPTRLYVNLVRKLCRQFPIQGIAHITGGGLLENLPRIFPEDCRGLIYRRTWTRPPLFEVIQKWGHVAEEEMERVFNCGIGMVLVVPSESSTALMSELQKADEPAWIIGEIVARKKENAPLEIL